eukprot:TRINITY_DN523_c1_g1_i1.p1 TRINITY_DN523_c1_g1~~TRINITY_DN523_c1_g1_i1.p1  ORF type:complete len:254 (+),score=69.52 TRINITY_DN523_c1_g1_i1:137-898(+)
MLARSLFALQRIVAPPPVRAAMTSRRMATTPKPIVVDAVGEHRSTLLFFHGLGDSGAGFLDVAEYLGTKLPHTRFVLPTAPTQPVSINMGAQMPSWYDIRGLSDRDLEDFEGLERSMATVHELIALERERVACENIAVGGFSQGGALSLYAAYQYAHGLAAVVALSAYLPLKDKWLRRIEPANAQTKAFIGHGMDDPMVAVDLAHRTKAVLEGANIPVEMHVYDGLPHSVCVEEIDELARFLGGALPGANSKL